MRILNYSRMPDRILRWWMVLFWLQLLTTVFAYATLIVAAIFVDDLHLANALISILGCAFCGLGAGLGTAVLFAAAPDSWKWMSLLNIALDVVYLVAHPLLARA